MTIERSNNKIILTLDKNIENIDCCSICSSGKVGNHTPKPITIENGIIAYLLSNQINGKRYCMKCSHSIKKLASNISKKQVMPYLTFHTVKLQPYTHWINPFKKEKLYLKPDNYSAIKHSNAIKLNPLFQFNEHPYSLEDYKDWNKTIKAYEKDLERETYAIKYLHDTIFLNDKNNYLYIEEAEKQFFLNLSERIKREKKAS